MKNLKNYFVWSLMLTFLIGLSLSGMSANIVYPWRSSTAIVKDGQSFEVWFNADAGQTVSAVKLVGPYHTENTTHSQVTGNWVYDPLSGNTYNTRLTVTVPIAAVADRYDLVLQTSSGDVVSHGAVKVVSQFKSNYYIMHFSDGHFYQPNHDTPTLMARKSAMIDMANIMGCEIIIETGDNMYNVRNHPEREVEYFMGIESQGVNGMTDAHAATFLTPGDHDAPFGNDWAQGTVQENSDFFNDYWGLQSHNFKYGNGRFMLLNNAWAVTKSSGGDHQYQTDDAIAWLGGDGSGGNFFLTAGHVYDKMHEFVHNSEPLDLVLAGDKHHVRNYNPWSFDDGSPTIAYIAASIRDHMEYNLFRVDNVNGTFNTVTSATGVVPVLYSGDKNNPSSWVLNLSMDYQSANDGSSASNTATIDNKYAFTIYDAHVRFVVPKGNVYAVTGGTITQEFDGDLYHIVDVQLDVPNDSQTSVSIAATSTGTNDASFLSQQNVPSTLAPGQVMEVSVTMKNTGTTTWTKQSLYKLGSQNPQDNFNWGTNRAELDNVASVAPNENEEFKVGITAPATTGTYDFQWKMVQDNVEWFGALSNNLTIEVTGSPVLIDGCDNLTGWNTAISQNSIDEKEGTSCLEYSGSSTAEFFKVFSTPYQSDISPSNAVLQFWYYVSDVTKLQSANQVEIGSAGMADASEYNWSLTGLSNGWNFISLKVSEAGITGGPADLNAINWFRIYRSKSGAVTSRVDAIQLIDDGTVIAIYPLHVNNGTGSGTYENESVVSVSAESAPAHKTFDTWVVDFGSATLANPLDSITSLTMGADSSVVTATYKDLLYNLTVNNGSGSGDYAYATEVTLVASTPPIGQQFDQWVIDTGSATLGDAFESSTTLTMPGETVSVSATYKSQSDMIDNCDALTGWTSSQTLALSGNFMQGTGSLQFTGATEVEFQQSFSPDYGANYPLSDAALQFWYYVSDASQMTGVNQVELGSGGAPDIDEYSWPLRSLSNGWNLVTLPLSDAGVLGTPNLNNLDWFRLYNFKNSSITTRLDAVKIIDKNAALLDACDALSGWSTAGSNSLLLSTTIQEGSGSVQMTGSGTNEFQKVFSPAYNAGLTPSNARLEFWYYISDPSKMSTTSNQVELGSGGVADVNEYNWKLSSFTAGWNLISLDLSAAGTTGGTPDLNAINWFRIYNSKSGSVTNRIDAIRLYDKTNARVAEVGEEILGKQVLIYPNPTSDYVTIDLGDISADQLQVEIYNLAGVKVMEPDLTKKDSSRFRLSLKGLKAGLYLVEMTAANDLKVTKRIMVQ